MGLTTAVPLLDSDVVEGAEPLWPGEALREVRLPVHRVEVRRVVGGVGARTEGHCAVLGRVRRVEGQARVCPREGGGGGPVRRPTCEPFKSLESALVLRRYTGFLIRPDWGMA